MSINPRLRYAENNGALPCIDPLVLGRVMERICHGHAPTLRDRITKALARLRKRLAQ